VNCLSDEIPYTFISFMRLASASFCFGRKIFLNPFCFANSVMGRMPFMAFTLPLSESSPTTMASAKIWYGIWFDAERIAVAIGRSNVEPCFFNSAGARLIVFFWIGNVRPEFLIAERTRSFDS